MDGKEHRWFIWAASLLPFLATCLALYLAWMGQVSKLDLGLFVGMYIVCALGISTGYHRLLSHRSFETQGALRFLLTAAGAMAGQGPPVIWAAHHRRHHRVADRPGDPHSPKLGGFFHSHLGWLLDVKLRSEPMRYCPDLLRDRGVRWLSLHFTAVVLFGLLLPGLIALAITGDLRAGLTGVLWGGFVRMFVVNHMTYAVNSFGHVVGRRRFETKDTSRNVWWLALPSFGEAWHNNHHAFPRSANHGMRPYEIDLSAGFIRSLEWLGLAKNVVRIDPEAIASKKRNKQAKVSGTAWVFAGAAAPPLADRPQGDAVSLTDVE